MQRLNESTVEHLEDCKRIQLVLLQHGWLCTLEEAESLWDKHSDNFAAGWLFLPDDDDALWIEVSGCLPETY